MCWPYSCGSDGLLYESVVVTLAAADHDAPPSDAVSFIKMFKF